MKSLLLIASICVVSISHAQIKTKTPTSTPAITNKAVLTKKQAVITAPLQGVAPSFVPPEVTRNINGVTIKYTAVKNPTETDNIKHNTSITESTIENGFNCTTSRETVSATSSSFMNLKQSGQGIYPGAIYTYNDFMMGNVMNPIGEGKRNPITLTTDNTNTSGPVMVTVPSLNPSEGSVNTAKQSMVQNFSTTTTAASMQYQYTYSQTDAALAMNLSAGGAYSGFSAGGGFSLNKDDHHLYITYDYVIPMYTISTTIPTTGFFTDAAITQTPNLIWLSSVTYGTRILANICVDESSLKNTAFVKFKYGDPDKAGVKVDADFLMQNKEAKYTINTYVVGTDVKALTNATSVEELKTFINSVLSRLSNQTAKPISYTMASMSSELIGIKSYTDEYVVKNCVPAGAIYKLQSASVEIWTGSDNKVAGSKAYAELFTQSNRPNSAQLGGLQVGNTMSNAEAMSGKQFPLGLDIVSTDAGKLLSDFQSGINRLDIFFDPKYPDLVLDEWDIATVKLTLKFVDQYNVPYSPIFFEMNNAKAHLKKNAQRLSCYFDGTFKPTTSVHIQ